MTLQWLHKVGELRFLSVHSPKVYEKTKHVVEGRKQAQKASGAETLPGTASQVPVSTAQEEPHFWTSNNHNDLDMYEDSLSSGEIRQEFPEGSSTPYSSHSQSLAMELAKPRLSHQYEYP